MLLLSLNVMSGVVGSDCEDNKMACPKNYNVVNPYETLETLSFVSMLNPKLDAFMTYRLENWKK